MTRHLTISLVVLPLLAGSLLACDETSAEAMRITQQTEWIYASAEPSCHPTQSGNRVVYKAVQHTPKYDVSRPEVPSGARITLFGNFLGNQPGLVMLHLSGASIQCEVVDWKDNSVTTVLPKLGLTGPKNAEILLVRPDGRIVKTFRILFVAQPDVLVHSDTVPLPLPPAPAGVAQYAQ